MVQDRKSWYAACQVSDQVGLQQEIDILARGCLVRLETYFFSLVTSYWGSILIKLNFKMNLLV